GLEPALMALMDRTRRGGIEVDEDVRLVHGSGAEDDRLSAELETGVYRIVQEALTNAGKHGGASNVTVSIVEEDGRVTVTVRDDGSGFDPAAGTSGFGLAGMRERAEMLGGELSVTSASEEGTTVSVTLPVVTRRDPGALGQPSRPRSRA